MPIKHTEKPPDEPAVCIISFLSKDYFRISVASSAYCMAAIGHKKTAG
jgi:hypothetical protein